MDKLRRFVWYLAGRLFVLLLVVSLMVVTFYYAMNAANISVVLKDGMARRAQVIMMGEDAEELTKFFQSAYLQMDENLQNAINGTGPYQNYTIRGIDHRLELTWMWCWPWETTARAEFTERVPRIDGRIKGEYRESAVAQLGESAVNPPAWQAASYVANMVKENGQWHIKSIAVKELLGDE